VLVVGQLGSEPSRAWRISKASSRVLEAQVHLYRGVALPISGQIQRHFEFTFSIVFDLPRMIDWISFLSAEMPSVYLELAILE